MKPWQPIQSDENLAGEAARELSDGHPLYGKKLKAIARRQDQDDVLFELIDDTPRVAVLHLTWSGKREKPPWPRSDIYQSLDDFAKSRMESDAIEF
jgi:hypothetical protein